jgi:hypothetical protein
MLFQNVGSRTEFIPFYVDRIAPLTGGGKADTLAANIRNRSMSVHILKPTVMQATGQPPKTIEEYVGRVNSQRS